MQVVLTDGRKIVVDAATVRRNRPDEVGPPRVIFEDTDQKVVAEFVLDSLKYVSFAKPRVKVGS